MIKKAFIWAKTTELWINLAQIYTVFLCFFIVAKQLWNLIECEKIIGLIAFVILVIISYRYELYKTLIGKIFIAFFLFTYLEGYVVKADCVKVFGSIVHRNWYIYLTVLAVGYVLKDKRKDRWIKAIFVILSTLLASVFAVSIVEATKNIINPKHEVPERLGSFVNGRLSTFANANIAGQAAAALIIMSAILIYRARKHKHRVVACIVFSFFIVIGWAELGLCRSRGSIVAVATGIGVFFFILAYDRYEQKSVKAVLAGIGICVVTSLTCLILLILPKPLYHVAVTAYAEANEPEKVGLIKERVEAYGLLYEINTLTDRTDIWRTVIDNIDEKPKRWIWGITPQMVTSTSVFGVYPDRPEVVAAHSHSGYLEQLRIYGIPGAALLALVMLIWIVHVVKAVISNGIPTNDKIMVSIPAVSYMGALVEIFLFSHINIYIICFIYFIAEGYLEGSMEKRKSSIGKRIEIITCAITGFALVGLLTRYVYLKSMVEYEAVKEITLKEQNPEDFIRLNNGIESEMMMPEYWINLRANQGETDKEILSYAQIERLNNLNRRMISTGNSEFALKEIGNEFYYKVAKSLIADTAFTIKEPEKYYRNGEPTDEAYWEGLKENCNLDALNKRITVKFGVSVVSTILKRFPSDDRVFYEGSSMYYDELA